MLEASDLVKRYGPVTALDGFSLHMAAGEIVGLVGHNGAGKTTFVDIVSGLIQRNPPGHARPGEAVRRRRRRRRLHDALPDRLNDLGATIAVIRNGCLIARGTDDEQVKGLPGQVRICFADADEVKVSTTEPSATLIELLRRDDRPISSVEVHNASLGDLYRSLAASDDS